MTLHYVIDRKNKWYPIIFVESAELAEWLDNEYYTGMSNSGILEFEGEGLKLKNKDIFSAQEIYDNWSGRWIKELKEEFIKKFLENK